MPSMPREMLYTVLKKDFRTAAADTVVTISADAIANEVHVLRTIDVSYVGGTPTAAAVTVAFGGVTAWSVDLPLAEGVYHFEFPWGLYSTTPNQAMLITATDPGALTGAIIKLNAAWE